jgi:hypothetical protein
MASPSLSHPACTSDKLVRRPGPACRTVDRCVLAMLLAMTGLVARAQPADAQAPLAIEPMTTIGAAGEGYLADPQPVRLAPSSGSTVQILSGTTAAIISCAYPIRPDCFSWTPVSVDAGALSAQIAAAGATVTNIQNIDIFQGDLGEWHAAVTIGVNTKAHPAHWTVIAHAHPTATAAPNSAPLAWSADTVLSGSFTDPVQGNYDGKYFEDEGRLYLLYVRNFVPEPALRNGIVLQPMLSPTQLAPSAPATLLMTGDRYGDDLGSEFYANTQAKLVEAPYISRIGGKYALVYSTGAYLTPGYKAGVAWSDTLLPPMGSLYRKVLMPDTQGVWGVPGRQDVRYLVQSQEPSWPNFTGGQVIGPGVAAAVQGPGGGAWSLFFDGFAPGDMPLLANGTVDGSHRRPFYLGLRDNVPPGRTVSTATDAELAEWLLPEMQ